MPRYSRDAYDAIIIGAGISGLVCGCYLAKAGMKVLICEQHDKPGGYCSSFKRRGFLFDAAAHSFGSYREGGNFRKILSNLGIDKVIDIKRYNPSDIIITPDFRLTFWNETKAVVSQLIDIFPEEEKGIRAYYDYYQELTSQNQFGNIKLRDKTFGSFLQTFFEDKTLMNSISFPVFGNGGLPPSLMHAFTGTKIYHEFLLDGGYYPEGGMQSLPNALTQLIIKKNGKILLRRLVKKILCKNNSVVGVMLDNNESYISKYVVSACDTTQTFKTLLARDMVAKEINAHLRHMLPSLSTFILYIGVDRSIKRLPQPGTNIWYLPYYDLDKIFHYVNIGDFDNVGGFMLRVSPDERTILAFTLAPFKTKAFWKNHKKKMVDDFLTRIESVIPDLRRHAIYLDAASPHTLFRYTRNYKGANYGWAPLTSQLFDPHLRQKTSVEGLYLSGHWTTQTHGIPGVAYLGYNTAKLILKREGIDS